MNPREIAVRILQARERHAEFTEDLLARELAQQQLSPPDRGLLQELSYGVVRWQRTLDWLIARKTPGRTQKAALQILLRLGLYQLFWLERVPDHAAVDEAVTLARQLGYGPQAGFINAVLRGYIRERTATEQLIADLKTQDPALGYSHPDWLFDRWEARWGREQTCQLMDWNNHPPKTFARVNMLRIRATELEEIWKAEGVSWKVVEADWLPKDLVFELTTHPPFRSLPSFEKGYFYVQDPSTLLAVQAMDPAPAERIADLCAAPGGKTAYIAQRMDNRGEIVALDLNPERLKLVAENCERLGVTCVQCAGAPPAGSARFDRVLLDAPCSNTGVMRRRIDLRWRVRPEEIARLQQTQLQLLRDAAPWVKPGGRLVYSTCSLEPEENRQVIDTFLNEQGAGDLITERELLPMRDGFDGAYVATLLAPSFGWEIEH